MDMHQELARFATHYPRIRFPDRLQLDETARKLVIGLLHPQPRKRIGCRCRGARELLTHEFFHGFDWETLLRQSERIRPASAWKPAKSLNQFDADHFEHFHHHIAEQVANVDVKGQAVVSLSDMGHWSTAFAHLPSTGFGPKVALEGKDCVGEGEGADVPT
jgi:hypothetical protein